jgi:hypothetical protein
MAPVCLEDGLGEEHLDRLTDQLFAGEAELPFELLVDVSDAPGGIHEEYAVGEGFRRQTNEAVVLHGIPV